MFARSNPKNLRQCDYADTILNFYELLTQETSKTAIQYSYYTSGTWWFYTPELLTHK